MDEKVIVGNVVGVPNPKSDYDQQDPTKADFIKNKPLINLGSIDDLSYLDSVCAGDNVGKIFKFYYSPDGSDNFLVVNSHYGENDVSQLWISSKYGIQMRTTVDGGAYSGHPRWTGWKKVFGEQVAIKDWEIQIGGNDGFPSDICKITNTLIEVNRGDVVCHYPGMYGNEIHRLSEKADASTVYKTVNDVYIHENGIRVGSGWGINIIPSGIEVENGDVVASIDGGGTYHKLSEKADQTYVDEKLGDIETALDSIIAIQNNLIGGETE